MKTTARQSNAAHAVMESYIRCGLRNMIKIAVVGPESSGKTTMCEALALEFGSIWVEEFARAHLEEHGPEYTEPDLLNIAKGQVLAEGQAIKRAEERCDRDACQKCLLHDVLRELIVAARRSPPEWN